MKFIFLKFILFGAVSFRSAFAEVFTALVHMIPLFHTEEFLINALDNYIKQTQLNLHALKTHLKKFQEENNEARRGVQTYLSNPVNAYLLTKRLTSDWEKVEDIMTQDVGKETVRNITYHRENNLLIFPTEEDLNGAADAIVRLQKLYNLNTSSLAKGDVKGVQTGSELSSSDCFEVGRQCYNNNDFHNCIKWMKEAFHRYRGEINKTSDEFAILDFLSYCSFMEGDIESAYHLNGKLLEIDPNVKYLQENRIFYKNALKQQKILLKERNKSDEVNVYTERELKENSRKKNDYEKLCRNELTVSEKVRAKLKCRYVDFGRPFLKLAKIKEEEAFLNPRVVIYHDVLSDREINVIKNLSVSMFERAEVFERNGERHVNYRISKVAWLEDYMHPVVAAVSRRVEDITNLDMSYSESLQVVNYGMGGFYAPHFDFYREFEKEFVNWKAFGNRIATFLFYMNDVLEGGATAFPTLKIAAWPKKGSAILWFNLQKNGEKDFLMRHAACPVLFGTKWICNKWIGERGQEFRFRCGLNYDDY